MMAYITYRRILEFALGGLTVGLTLYFFGWKLLLVLIIAGWYQNVSNRNQTTGVWTTHPRNPVL